MQKTPGGIILLHICTINQDHDVRFLRYKVQRTKFFVIMGHFLSFDPPNNPKNQNFERTVIWCMVPEISSTTDIIFSHFGLFFAILPPPPPLSKNPENQNFEKMKKTPRDIIISFYTSTLNQNHMMYDSWDTKCNRQIFFSHLGPFFTLLPLLPSPNNPKNQNFEKMKQNARDIIILHKSTINDNQDIWFLRYINCNRQNFLSYWDIFCPFTPLTAQKVKISEKWKKHIIWTYHHFTQLYQKSWS